VRPPGQAVPLLEWDKPEQDDRSFEIYVRRYGQAQRAAQSLLRHLRRWEKAGRPNLDRVAIRAVPADRPVKLSEGEQLRERPWTNLVIRFL
jgi:hypothetical protein